MSVTSWDIDGVDWESPDPNDCRVLEAFRQAIVERAPWSTIYLMNSQISTLTSMLVDTSTGVLTPYQRLPETSSNLGVYGGGSRYYSGSACSSLASSIPFDALPGSNHLNFSRMFLIHKALIELFTGVDNSPYQQRKTYQGWIDLAEDAGFNMPNLIDNPNGTYISNYRTELYYRLNGYPGCGLVNFGYSESDYLTSCIQRNCYEPYRKALANAGLSSFVSPSYLDFDNVAWARQTYLLLRQLGKAMGVLWPSSSFSSSYPLANDKGIAWSFKASGDYGQASSLSEAISAAQANVASAWSCSIGSGNSWSVPSHWYNLFDGRLAIKMAMLGELRCGLLSRSPIDVDMEIWVKPQIHSVGCRVVDTSMKEGTYPWMYCPFNADGSSYIQKQTWNSDEDGDGVDELYTCEDYYQIDRMDLGVELPPGKWTKLFSQDDIGPGEWFNQSLGVFDFPPAPGNAQNWTPPPESGLDLSPYLGDVNLPIPLAGNTGTSEIFSMVMLVAKPHFKFGSILD